MTHYQSKEPEQAYDIFVTHKYYAKSTEGEVLLKSREPKKRGG
jgi:hypothetical protein